MAKDTAVLLDWLEQDPEMIQQIGYGSPKEVVDSITKIFMSANSTIVAAENGTGELIGWVAATNAQADGSANVHIGISPQHRGKGARLMREGLRFAFENLGLKILIAAVPKGRDRVETFNRRFGFTEPDAKILFLTKTKWEERDGGRRGSN